jgi:hypothetical protein
MYFKEDETNVFSTQNLPEGDYLRTLIDRNNSRGKTDQLGRKPEVGFQIRGMTQTYQFSDTNSLVIGRADFSNVVKVDIDLSNFGAHQRGISRVHAILHLLPGNRLYIRDMGSANGTFLTGERLEPYQPKMVRNGDSLVLGRLPIQVFYK